MKDELLDTLQTFFSDVPEVRVAYLFGSRARGEEHQKSDVDIAVLLDSPMSFSEQDKLKARLRSATGADDVDLLSIAELPPEFAFRVIDEGQLAYCASEYERVELEADILSRYGDYLPVLRQQRRAILEGVDHDRAVRRYRKALGKTRRLLEQIGTADRST